MKKCINFRPIFYCFVALCLGIFFSKQIFSANFYVIFLFGITAVVVLYLCLKYKCIKRFLSVLASFVLGMGVFLLSVATFSTNFENKNCQVTGRIATVSTYSGLQNVVLDKTYIDGVYVNKNIAVLVRYATTMEEGYEISFYGYVEKTNLFTLGKFNSYYYNNNIALCASTTSSDVTTVKFVGFNLAEKVRIAVKKTLFDNMSEEEASISYASLFGDKTYVNDTVKENFSISEIAHLLAVSGLHIGFLTTMLSFLLNKTKNKKYINIIIISIVLAFYCYLCSFSVSCVRASLMFLVLSIASMIGKQYDKLNSLAMAGIIVLIYKPLSVFDAGFLLSFASVFSIFLFSLMFKNLFGKWHMPPKLSESLSIILSVQLGILPLTVYYYGQVSLLSILANFICIPIFEIFFTLLFAIVPLATIIKPLGILLTIPSLVINFVVKIAQIVAEQKWACVNLQKLSPFAIVAVYVLLFIISGFVNLNKTKKFNFAVCFSVVAMLISVGMTTPLFADKSITMLCAYDNSICVIELDGKTFAIGDFNASIKDATENYSNNVAFKKLDYVFTTNSFIPLLDETKVYTFSKSQENSLEYNTIYNFNQVNLFAYEISGKFCGVELEYNNFKIFVARGGISFDNLYTLEQNENFDVLICKKEVENMQQLNIATTVVGNNVFSQFGNAKMEGNWTISFNNDKIFTRRIDWTF